MNVKSSLAGACAVLLLAAPAIGAPLISGKYAYASRIYCQSILNVTTAQDSNGGQIFVNGVGLPYVGLMSQKVGTADFDVLSGNFGVDEVEALGSPILVQLPGQTQGFAMFQRSQVLAGTFSNTATTVTLTWPQGGTYAAVYGKVAKGIVQYMALVGLVTINTQSCSQQIEFSRK